MTDYISKWFEIIERMNYTNTYKPAFGRAIVECVKFDRYTLDESKSKAVISFVDIAECMVRYYWDQDFFFHLKQQPGSDVPLIYQEVSKLIKRYKDLMGTTIPCWSADGIGIVRSKDEVFLDKIVLNCAKTLKKDVSWRFPKIGSEYKDIYVCDRNGMTLTFDLEAIAEIKDYCYILTKLLNYKWSLLLEKFNTSPEILNKINDVGNTKIQRSPLTKFRDILLKNEFHSGTACDFYSSKSLNPKDISVDHVIPWSFIYKDNIWNLVLTDKSTNSSKNNSVPKDDVITHLKQRNLTLLPLLPKGKEKDDLNFAIKENLVDKYYMMLKAS